MWSRERIIVCILILSELLLRYENSNQNRDPERAEKSVWLCVKKALVKT